MHQEYNMPLLKPFFTKNVNTEDENLKLITENDRDD